MPVTGAAPAAVRPSGAAKPQEKSTEHAPRKFVFLELFAGHGGFSRAVTEIAGDVAEVMGPLGGFYNWDIFVDADFEQAKQSVKRADHTHLAFTCSSFTRERWTDENEVAQVITSDKIAEKVAALCYLILEAGGTFSLENPWDSYAWEHPALKRVLKRPGVQSVLLHQCAYGADNVNPTAIVSNAPWILTVKLTCKDVRAHCHTEGDVAGKVDASVWRTSLAKYPVGLCQCWAKALRAWLLSEEGRRVMASRTLVRAGRLGNTLVRLDRYKCTELEPAPNSDLQSAKLIAGFPAKTGAAATETAAARRCRENEQAIGGLRDPRRAVARSSSLRQTGAQIRHVMDEFLSDELVAKFENANGQCPFSSELVQAARFRLAQSFHTEPAADGYQTNLFKTILHSAKDPDRDTIPQWLEYGFPLGIEEPIANNGVFPETDSVSAAIKASQALGTLLEDWDGSAKNYKSFEEAGEKGQAELDRLVACGRATKVSSWGDVVCLVGEGAKLTKLACIIKIKDGKEKVRLVVDMRRSGINGLMALRERVILPRVSDVAESVHALFLKNNRSPNCEFFISDFKDAFYTLPLRTSERKYAVVKGGPSTFYLIHVVSFGFACGPVLWCRLAACSNRIVQASVSDFEGRVQTYVDDPIMVACAPTKFERSRIFCRYTLLWCILGFEIAWHKCSRGASVCWIGVMLQLLPSGLKVMLCPEKTERLRGMFQELRRHGNMIPTQTLQTAAGVLGWIANLIPAARPWASMLWAAVHASQASHTPAKLNTRVRKGLTFRKQVEHALHWLESMLTATVGSGPQLERVYMWNEHAPVLELYTDACPTGLGGVLYSALKPVAYFSHQLTLEDAKLLGAQLGDPAFQSEFELYSVLVAVLVFQDFLVRGKSQCPQSARVDAKMGPREAAKRRPEARGSAPSVCPHLVCSELVRWPKTMNQI